MEETHHPSDSGGVEPDLNQILRARRAKLAKLHELGVNPYPYRFEVQHHIAEILERFDDVCEKEGSPGVGEHFSIAGRIVTIRAMGKASFCHLRDDLGQMQLYIKKDTVGERRYEIFKLLDIGDIIGAAGTVFRTHTGEKTLRVQNFELLCKNLYPLPIVKECEEHVFDAFTDKEARYRERHLDLAVNPDVRTIFEKRAQLIRALRRFLDERSFLEVETPILQPLYGGALARPFTTEYHTLERTFFLRIADELYLKRLLVGGFPKVYEISKVFRNEGMDRSHNPEFTMLEFYEAYTDYHDAMDLTEEMLRECALAVSGSYRISYRGTPIDFEPSFRRVRFFELLRELTSEDLLEKPLEELQKIARRHDIEEPAMSDGKIFDELMKTHVFPKLVQPTIVYDYPLSLSPLAKKHREDPRLVERFQVFAGGLELGNAFSELNDPLDQRARFEVQQRFRAEGDEETPPLDEDFLRALEYGMPPASGVGIGIDRLTMLLTDQASIREVILFPALRT
jgi:lysyl-tRNA synthetase class 2